MKGWSNPSGQPLREVIPGKLWAAERPFIWYGIDVGGRMAVVRLDDGSLWVHSPVPLDPSLKEEIDKLGTLRYVVSPNYEHCGFAQQWVDAYPTAVAYACPGLVEKRPDIKYSKTVGNTDDPPAEWNGEFELAWLDCEHNPFNGQPFFNEVVFYHKPSQALFVSDLFWNYPTKETPFGTWLWKQGMDRIYLPFYKKFMLYKRDRFYQQLQRIENWDWETLVPCHGDVVLSQAKAALSKHLTQACLLMFLLEMSCFSGMDDR